MLIHAIKSVIVSLCLALLATSTGFAQENRQADVIYGRKYGLALTLSLIHISEPTRPY